MIFKDVFIGVTDTDKGLKSFDRISQIFTGYVLTVNNMIVESTLSHSLVEFHEKVKASSWADCLPPYSTLARKLKSSVWVPLETNREGLSITVNYISIDLLKMLGQ